jgi:cell division septation protein DedD
MRSPDHVFAGAVIRAGTLITVALMVCTAAGASGPEYTAGMELLRQGIITEARAQLEKAYRRTPGDPSLRLAYARSAPCSTALRMYRELAADKTVPDSIRAIASARCGDHAFAGRNYGIARDRYQEAARVGTDPFYRHMWALSAASNGDGEAAKSLWHAVALESDGAVARRARCSLGILHLKLGKYDEAYSELLKSGSTATEYPWSYAALAGKTACAHLLGLSKISEYKPQLDQTRSALLEREYLKGVLSRPAVKSTPEPPVAPATAPALHAAPSTSAYTLQVGAFGSMDNASRLQQKLSKQFKDVTVATVTVGDQVFYRVRVGTFTTREDAGAFASEKFTGDGVSARIVEK